MKLTFSVRATAMPRGLPLSLLLSACVAGAYSHAFAETCEPGPTEIFRYCAGRHATKPVKHAPLLGTLEEALKIPVIVVELHSYGAVMEGMLSGALNVAGLGPASYVAAKSEDRYITAFASYARSPDIFN